MNKLKAFRERMTPGSAAVRPRAPAGLAPSLPTKAMKMAPASPINVMTDYPLKAGCSAKGGSMTSKLSKSEQLHLPMKR